MSEREYDATTITEISFPGGKIKDGHIKADPDWQFTSDEKTGGALLRQIGGGPGVIIDPCECALETGGSCVQVSAEDDDGVIIEIWCEDNGCGFCVGGVRPEAGLDFRLKLTFARAAR